MKILDTTFMSAAAFLAYIAAKRGSVEPDLVVSLLLEIEEIRDACDEAKSEAALALDELEDARAAIAELQSQIEELERLV